MEFREIKDLVEKSNPARLIAVSKTKPIEEIQRVYELGQRLFGENRVQEVTEKYDALPKDIEWHLIGTLQKNKVKYIAPFIATIHSVDNLDLAIEINKQALKFNRKIPVLLQIKIADEATKQGFEWEELDDETCQSLSALNHIDVVGVMGMASFTDDGQQIRDEFKNLKAYFEVLKNKYFQSPNFREISMGMSGDYMIALEEGATLVRIGSAIFGGR